MGLLDGSVLIDFLKVNEAAAEVCRTIAPYSLRLCDAFQLSDAMLSAPIARDWVDYNVGDNRGEV